MRYPYILMDVYDRLYKCYGPQHWWPGDTRLEVIVGAILTQNTAWANVEKAIRNLKEAGALSSVRNIAQMDRRRLARLIHPSGYYNIKSERLKDFTGFLSAKYGGSLQGAASQKTERLRQDLLGVRGIGPETCDSILLYAFKRPVFVVDAYTKRIFSRHNLFSEKADYNHVQQIFMDNLPKGRRLYNEYHALIVRLGKELCRKMPHCAHCPLKGLKFDAAL